MKTLRVRVQPEPKQHIYKSGGIRLRNIDTGYYMTIPLDQAADIADQLIYLAEELEQQKEHIKENA